MSTGISSSQTAPPAVSPEDVADAVLAAAAHTNLRGIVLAPDPGGMRIETLEAPAARCLATLPRALGLATTRRLAQLAGIDMAATPAGGVGRLRAVVADSEVDYVIDVSRDSERATHTEVLRLSSAQDEAPGAVTPQTELQTLPYRIESELGRGGMGVVFKAFHEVLERHVAIKVLHANRAHRDADNTRFLREARAASRVQHPGVAAVLDFGTLRDGRGFMVMELVEAATLRAMLTRGPIPPARAVQITRRIASAIEAAHQHGVIHRDLKPENIFVLPTDDIKIVDFGAAKLLASSLPGDTVEGRVLGTPRYMAPEHATGTGTDRRTDVYALGCVLFEMLTGTPPYDDDVATVVVMRHVQAPIPPIRLEDARLGRLLNGVVRRAMAKAPADRYATARAFERDLARVMQEAERDGWWRKLGL